MKKIFRALTLCLVLLSLLCAAVPAAFAAGNKEDAFYTIGLDACGGVSSTVVVTTNLDGKLTTLPEPLRFAGHHAGISPAPRRVRHFPARHDKPRR